MRTYQEEHVTHKRDALFDGIHNLLAHPQRHGLHRNQDHYWASPEPTSAKYANSKTTRLSVKGTTTTLMRRELKMLL